MPRSASSMLRRSCPTGLGSGCRLRHDFRGAPLPCPPPRRQYLEVIGRCMGEHSVPALFYLAAAVSDYYIPWEQMVRARWALLGGGLD